MVAGLTKKTGDISQGEHVTGFDFIADGELGCDRAHPNLIAPDCMSMSGLPYGAWCKCYLCGLIGRSTYAFDFYGSAGEELKCENCLRMET